MKQLNKEIFEMIQEDVQDGYVMEVEVGFGEYNMTIGIGKDDLVVSIGDTEFTSYTMFTVKKEDFLNMSYGEFNLMSCTHIYYNV